MNDVNTRVLAAVPGVEAPTGEQHRLAFEAGGHAVEATVTELGATLRSLRVDGLALVAEYPLDVPPPGAAGVVLAPWPNRVADATWTLEGSPQRLDVTERDTGNASHGLLRNTGYAVVERSDAAITLAASVFPQHGYPFLLRTTVRYEVTAEGVEVTHTVRNASARPAPVALGAHPYLCVGEEPAASLSLTVRASTLLETDERSIPVARASVEGTPSDLRHGPWLEGLDLDTAYTDLEVVGGCYRHVLSRPDGAGAELWAEEDFGYVQVFLSHEFVGLRGRTSAVAVEPMTAPANAFNSGEGLRWLEPGETWSLRWGIRRVGS